MNCGKLSRRYIIVTDVMLVTRPAKCRPGPHYITAEFVPTCPARRTGWPSCFPCRRTTRHTLAYYHWQARLKSHKPSNTIAPAVHHCLSH